MTNEEIEQEIQAKKLTAARVTEKDVNDSVRNVAYHTFPGTTTTTCCITLDNGFTVVGKSACASPANFDQSLGQRIAFDDAKRQIWGLLGHQLRTDLYREQLLSKLIQQKRSEEDIPPTING